MGIRNERNARLFEGSCLYRVIFLACPWAFAIEAFRGISVNDLCRAVLCFL